VGLITIQPEEFAISRLQLVLSYTARRLKSRIRFPIGTWIHVVFVISRDFRGIVMGQASVSGSLTDICTKSTHLTKEMTMVGIGLWCHTGVVVLLDIFPVKSAEFHISLILSILRQEFLV